MKDKGINKPSRKKEDIIKFINGLDQGMINEDDESEDFDISVIKNILIRAENKEDLNNETD
ncbi:MAG: hypothetical protein O2887_11440 [Bacteroidetes bacterium]|nr:hypothetical protein [Bacteroidota bacterium]MDA1121084.1 hypothetical protein [Bacteroidota bacterium]